MSQSSNLMTSFCKEGNKLDGSSNFQAWNKIIDLVLIENEVIDYVLGKVTEPKKDKILQLAKYTKGEVRAQRFLVESVKDHLIPFVADLGIFEAIYDKLVKLYSVSTTG